jgi:4-amino-4-deoxy-L-arabinose transferase-like glycosyltransferase
VLWLAAVVLALHQLGNVPLRDWDEAIVARVALETSRHSGAELLLPTYLGADYLNKPPGMHLAIAAAIRLWRWLGGSGSALPPEAVVRLVPALASSLLVPLLGLVQARLRPGDRGAVLATALVTLTLLPLARSGRLAMLDGAQLAAMALIWLGVLSGGGGARGDLLAGLIAGMGGSALLLLKAPVAMPVLVSALALRILDRELDRGAWAVLGVGLALGLLPGLGWHLMHLAVRGDAALVMWGSQGLARLTTSLENHGGGPLVPVLQLLEGGWPWLPLWPAALALAWRQRRRRWGRWTLGLTLVGALLVFPLRTQLPWYSLLLWPPFALACGAALAALVRGELDRGTLPVAATIWLVLGAILLLAPAFALLPVAAALPPLGVLVLPAAAGLLAGGWWLRRRHAPASLRQRALLVLAGGWYLSLLALFSTPLWNWELNQQPPLSPALELVGGPARRPAQPIVIDDADAFSPSAIWYLDPVGIDAIPSGTSYLLLSRSGPAAPAAGRHCQLEREGTAGWKLWRCASG